MNCADSVESHGQEFTYIQQYTVAVCRVHHILGSKVCRYRLKKGE